MTDTPPPAANLLAEETSPYLLQHRDNPVHWRPWGDAAFAEAAATGKPVLLSIGYAACHWCHVMAHESFEDGDIAALMNTLFVNIKVDREERPDVDTIYQHALQLLGEQGGWPLTMFLTPERAPFWGGTYFPPEDRYGRPGFPKVLRRIDEIYRQEADKVATNAKALTEALGGLAATQAGKGVSDEVLRLAAENFLNSVDTVHGGIGGAPKFPQCNVFEFLWRAWQRSGTPQYRDAVLLTLDRMSQGGIYDHLGGGYARYSVDALWLVPHFEKMLYDNAQMIDLLTLAWQATGTPLYAERVRETVDWLLREMVVDGGGFAGTLDADSEGEEGRFYVWQAAEIDGLLGAEAETFKDAYDVRSEGNWEGKTILNRSRRPLRQSDAAETALAAARATLLAAREKRVRPALDDKIIADWNGLMIAALARAGRVFGEPGWIDAARAAFDFVCARMTATGATADGDPNSDGRLHHTWRAGQARHPATADDYAQLCRAALALFEATRESRYLAQAESWVRVLDQDHLDADSGAYNLSARGVDDVIVQTRAAFDNATPSGNGTLVHVFARLWLLTGEDGYRRKADGLLTAFSGNLERTAMGMPVLLSGRDLLANAVQVVVVDGEDGADTSLADAAWQVADPNLVIRQISPGETLPEGHPAQGKTAIDGQAAAYVCRGATCSLPITDVDALTAALDPTLDR